MSDKQNSARQALSSHATQKPGRTRRRASRAGTRRVSALTPAQLERKRAIDRESQRAIRQRTRERIERLETQIAGLVVGQGSAHDALWLNENIELQNTELRAQLDSADILFSAVGNGLNLHADLGGDRDIPLSRSYVQPLPGDNLYFRVPPLGPSPVALVSATYPPHGLFYTDGAEAVCSPCPVSPISSSPLCGETTTWRPEESIPLRPLSSDTERAVIPGLDRTVPASTGFCFLSGSNNLHHQSWICIGCPTAPMDESSRLIIRQAPTQEPILGATVTTNQQPTLHGWELPIQNLAPTCLIDHILLGFIHDRRCLAFSGMIGTQLIGPKYPSISSLLNPKLGIRSHPVSRVLTDILCAHPGLSCIPEKVAVLYVMYLLLQWQISPTLHTYNALPEWLCPRASQLVTPHPAWMDQIPWPRLRDRIINDQETYSTLEFQDILNSSIYLNWRHKPMDALVLHGEEIYMNSSFERHIRSLENWSLGPAFVQRYPELAETVGVVI